MARIVVSKVVWRRVKRLAFPTNSIFRPPTPKLAKVPSSQVFSSQVSLNGNLGEWIPSVLQVLVYYFTAPHIDFPCLISNIRQYQ